MDRRPTSEAIVVMVAALVTAVGAALPWVHFDPGVARADVRGLHVTDGKIVLAAAIAMLIGGAVRGLVLVLSLAGAVVAISVSAADIAHVAEHHDGMATAGPGLWAVVIAGSVGAAAALAGLARRADWRARSPLRSPRRGVG